VVNTPVLISLEIMKQEPDQSLYRHPFQPVAVLLEGEFESLYRNRIPPEIADDRSIAFRERSKPTMMLVVADGDIIRNQIQRSQRQPLPLGLDQDTRQQFGNREFLLNAVNYLTGDPELITVRSREVKLRLLDNLRIRDNKIFWQTFNTVVPVALVLVFGIIRFTLRKRKYTSGAAS
jgi:ABC-2 type transport system permease protein